MEKRIKQHENEKDGSLKEILNLKQQIMQYSDKTMVLKNEIQIKNDRLLAMGDKLQSFVASTTYQSPNHGETTNDTSMESKTVELESPTLHAPTTPTQAPVVPQTFAASQASLHDNNPSQQSIIAVKTEFYYFFGLCVFVLQKTMVVEEMRLIFAMLFHNLHNMHNHHNKFQQKTKSKNTKFSIDFIV